jgi:hypothetical protein
LDAGFTQGVENFNAGRGSLQLSGIRAKDEDDAKDL